MGHNNIRILLIVTLALQAQGAISFRAGRDQLLTGPPGPNAIAVADFNGDGHLDQAAVGFGEAVVYILLGEGNGRFRQVEAIPVGLNPVSIVTGDFNGDGNPDLAVGSEGAVSVLIGNGDGTFQAPVTYLKNVGNATAITSGDFNGDGKLDLAVAIGNNNYVYELPGNGDGTFAAPIKVFANADPFFVTAADLNGDGKLDLVVVNQAGVNSVLSILLGNGDGTFSKPKDVFNAANNGYWIAVADFNGDGIPDLALANQNAPNVTILLGTGGGNFGTPAAVDVGSTSGSRGLAVLDFNGDGKLDLAVVNFISGTLALAAGKGNGTFAAPKLMGMNQPAAVATGDFNGDGTTDLSV
ncbi:MAG TPA: VCBS repeat-containing protein, partial [Bryobacteraceae bacterium]|nr:VCBS repeat-containing protein [Bryobacteraceae bacterium]